MVLDYRSLFVKVDRPYDPIKLETQAKFANPPSKFRDNDLLARLVH
ncbi:hypothetical protein [Microcoleus sp. S28C3]